MLNLSQRSIRAHSSPIRKLAAYANQAKKAGKKVWHLNIGQPDILAPEQALRAVKEANLDLLPYSPSRGIPTYLEKLPRYYKKYDVSVNPDDILVTNGASEALLFALLACLDANESVLTPEPFYANYLGFAGMAGVQVKPLPTTIETGFALPSVEAFRLAITPDVRAILLCNPNNPTGTAEPRAILREFILSLPPDVTCIVDEAYLDFADDPAVGSVADLVGNSRRLVVLRTFSKLHGMAGVRCGYAITRPDIVNDIAGVRMSTPNIFAMRAARASLGDLEFLADTRRRILASRRRICGELDALGLAYAKSQGNFVFFDTHMPIVEFEQIMLARNIRVGRPFPPFDTWCRITVGRESEVDAFLAALRAVHAPALRKAV